MIYLRTYKLFESMNTLDIKYLFADISDEVKYDVRVNSVVTRTMLGHLSDYCSRDVLNDHPNRLDIFQLFSTDDVDLSGEKFIVSLKTDLRLLKKRPSTSYQTFSIVDIYDNLRFVSDYIKENGLSIKGIEVEHIIPLPRIYSSRTTVNHTKVSLLGNKSRDTNYTLTETDDDLIERIKSMEDVRKLILLIF